MRKLTFLLLAVLVINHGDVFSIAPDGEFRAVWLTTYAGLDWPKSYTTEEQKSSLLEILDRLYEDNFNAVIFQVRSRGDAFYQSSFEPWARELTGVIGTDPGWDPLAFLIEHAHDRGIEVHAWFNVYKVWGGIPIPYDLVPAHILDRHPGWGQLYGGEWWLDPGEPGVHTFLMKVALDLIERYPVDGIHFDHIRYPGRDFDDEVTYRRFGGEQDIHDWRRDNITNFVREFYRNATAIRPNLKIGSAPMGVYKSVPGFSGSTAYMDYYQDPEKWLREGIHDYIVPQVYWNVAHNPKFDIVMHDWKNRGHGRHVYGGIGLFRADIHRELNLQISITRAIDIPGQVYFRYSHLGNFPELTHAYRNAVRVPSMPWKENRIHHIKERVIMSDPMHVDTLILPSWIPAHLRFAIEDNSRYKRINAGMDKSSSPQRYIIYRSDKYPIDTNNPEHLLAVLPATTASLTEEMNDPASSDYTYLVTVLNGSDEVNKLTVFDRIDETARMLNREILFPLMTDTGSPDSYHLSIYMPRGASAAVWIKDELTGDRYTIIEGFLDAGIHTVPIHRYLTRPFMRCAIQVGDRITERFLKRSE